MNVQTSVTLAPFTTFHIGGPARVYCPASTIGEVNEAIAYARDNALPLFVLGNGSNILVPDAGFDGVVLHMLLDDMNMEDKGEYMELCAGAGAIWEDIVDAACMRALHGIENLAGIPGTLGGAVVQNIGAYGAELAPAFAYAEAIRSDTGETMRITNAEATFGYRSSIFRKHPELVITRVALSLPKNAELRTNYVDLAEAAASGTLTNPTDVARAVRAIRAAKFPSRKDEGTAGSFFKNPILTQTHAAFLAEKFPGLPTFPQGDGTVKVPLAWILDHVVSLKGYARGPVRLYEKQPLVIVAQAGARASDVDALAHEIAENVREATGIIIEREVETVERRFMKKESTQLVEATA